jgi:beta-lactamase superfamily II metal-dependent hydrolase
VLAPIVIENFSRINMIYLLIPCRIQRLTILHRGQIPMMLRVLMGAWLVCAAMAGPVRAADTTLKMVSIDLEGGGGTLFVTPEGRSLLIDTGSPPGSGVRNGLDGATNGMDRVVAAARSLGVDRIDFLIITHYHADHIGGVFELLSRMPVGTVIDHGPNRDVAIPEEAPDSIGNRMVRDSIANYARYLSAIQGHPHIVARPGDVLRFGTLTDTIVASDGATIARPLPGAGGNGALCDTPPMAANGGLENEKSVGSILRFGKVTIAALGDLTWNREHDLFCPIDKVGHVNILLVTNHGMAVSSNPASIAAMRPDIAILGNSATKGDVPATIETINATPGLQGFWKLHASTADPALTGDPDFIANLDAAPDHGESLRLEITRGGRVTVTNSRNGLRRSYQVR